VAIFQQWLESFHQVLLAELFSVPFSNAAMELLGWDEDIFHNVNDAIPRNDVRERDVHVSVDLDLDQATKAEDVDAEMVVMQESGQVDLGAWAISATAGSIDSTHMEDALGNLWGSVMGTLVGLVGLVRLVRLVFLDGVGLVECVRVECFVGDDMILQQGLQKLLAASAEEESIRSRSEFLRSQYG
jgi:hypothetical protein